MAWEGDQGLYVYVSGRTCVRQGSMLKTEPLWLKGVKHRESGTSEITGQVEALDYWIQDQML